MSIRKGTFGLAAIAAGLLVPDPASATYMLTTGYLGACRSSSTTGSPYNTAYQCSVYDATDYAKGAWTSGELEFNSNGATSRSYAGKICVDYYGSSGGCCSSLATNSGSGYKTVDPSLTCWVSHGYDYPYVYAELENPAMFKGFWVSK
jgi:hypothetical protein